MPEELEVIARENRRLLAEVKDLRGRVEAVESSRWWRANPRRLLARVRPDGRAPESPPPAWASRPPDELTERFRSEVVARGSFRDDEFTITIPTLERFLPTLDGRETNLLEIGSFEGMSAAYLLWRLPQARLTCIDTFAGGASFEARGADVSGLEAAFDRNVALVDAARVRKLVGDSAHLLPRLLDESERFDLVYVDGSDFALDVLVDGCLAWAMLRPGGYLIFDNYLWRSPLGEDPLFAPAAAIDAFLGLVAGHVEVLDKEKQAIVRRLEA